MATLPTDHYQPIVWGTKLPAWPDRPLNSAESLLVRTYEKLPANVVVIVPRKRVHFGRTG